jgi:hypothetical protein
MSEIQTPESADYLVDAGGSIRINEAGSGVVRAFRDAERAYDQLQLAWAGACLAGLFIRHSWLQSLRITLTATAEYNDEGGSYRSVSNSVAQVQPVPGVPLPASMLDQGEFDGAWAAQLIEIDLDEIDLDLYSSIRTDYDDCGELVLTPSRTLLDAMPGGGPTSGAEAYRAYQAMQSNE